MERKIEVLGFYNGHQLLDGDGKKADLLKIIELAGRTCYKSFDKITVDSAKQFVHKLLRVYKHESVIEHSWFPLFIDLTGLLSWEIILDILTTNGLFKVTKKESGWLLSGNARMFRDYILKSKKIWKYDIRDKLKNEYPELFQDIDHNNMDGVVENDIENDFKTRRHIKIYPDISEFASLDEKLKHWWLAVRFKGGSRAFTHQLVRHRPCAISQESQRYCDEAGFFDNQYYVIPESIKELKNTKLMDLIGDGGLENDLTLEEWYKTNLLLMDSWYRNLQNFLKMAKEKGLAKMKVNEDARFLLPNAVCSEIVVSANLEEWRHIFKMRCDLHAQWEIRDFAMMVLKKAKSLFPGVFDDFLESKDEKSAFSI